MMEEFPFTQPRTLCGLDFGGSSSSQSQRTTNQPTLPPGFGRFGAIGTEEGQLQAGLANGAIPSIASLIQGYPLQGVAPLTGAQNFDINALQGLARNPFQLSPMEQAGANTYGNAASVFGSLASGGPAANFSSNVSGAPNSAENQAQAAFRTMLGGPNVAVPYGQKVFNDMVAPTVSSQMALAGLGNSGALGENLAMAGEAMALPMAEQGLQMEEAGAQGLAGLGTAEQNAAINAGLGNASLNLQGLGLRQNAMLGAGAGLSNIASGQTSLGENQFSQGITNLSNALTAAGIPQQQAQAILNAAYQQRMGQSNLGANVQQMISSWLPSALTGNTQTVNLSGGGKNWGVDTSSLFG